MKGFLVGIGAVVGIVLIFVLYYLGAYNGLVSRQENVKRSWAQVQNDYQRRADLVPNLVATVKGAANFEKGTLEAVVQARAKVGTVQLNANDISDPAKLQQFEQAQGQLSSALSRLMVVVEKYPELKATSNFSELQSQLEGTENRITVARRDFNETVQEYNTAVRRMPTSLVASIGGFKEWAYFQTTTPGAEKAPEVKF